MTLRPVIFLILLGITVQSIGQVGQKRSYEIFGSKNKSVTVSSESLKGTVFYLVSGHGGPDPGAIGDYGSNKLCEDEYAYDVTLRLARKLIEKGALVYMITRDPNDGIRDEAILTSDHDELCYPKQKIPLNQLSRLSQRTKAVNGLYRKYRGRHQRVIFIHLDSRNKGDNIDVFFYHDAKSKSGKKLAVQLKKKFKEKYSIFQPNRSYSGTVSSRNLYVLRNTNPTAVLIELGNIRNPGGQRRFVLKDNREALAKWIGEGLEDDYKAL